MVIHQQRTCKILFPLLREFLNGLPGQVPNGPTTAQNVLSSRVFFPSRRVKPLGPVPVKNHGIHIFKPTAYSFGW
jgi:hypothetical protein